MRLANWPCGIREAHGAARERAEQRDSGARWKKEGGEEAADERARAVRETGAAALAGLRVEGGASAGPARAVGCGPSGERRGRSGPVLG